MLALYAPVIAAAGVISISKEIVRLVRRAVRRKSGIEVTHGPDDTAAHVRDEPGTPLHGPDNRLAAERGDANAQFDLGVMYAVARSHAEAARWYRLAAEQGDAGAQSELDLVKDRAIHRYRYLLAQAHAGAGDYARAAAEFDAAGNYLEPGEDAAAVINRGRARFYQGRFAAAARNFVTAKNIAPSDPYAVIWVHLARGRAGERTRLESYARELDLSAWPGPVVEMYLGRATPEDVMAAVGGGNEAPALERLCQAIFHIGQEALLRGDEGQAAGLFGNALDMCPPGSAEHAIAAAELARVGE